MYTEVFGFTGRLGTGHISRYTREFVKSENFNGKCEFGTLEIFHLTRNSVKNDSGKSENLCILKWGSPLKPTMEKLENLFSALNSSFHQSHSLKYPVQLYI